MTERIAALAIVAIASAGSAADLDPLTTRWTFGAHEPYTMYRRVGRTCTGSIDGNALWVGEWLDWFDAEAPGLRGRLEFGFARCGDGRSDVHCWTAPDGFDAREAASRVELRTSRTGDVTRYDALIPFAKSKGLSEKALEDDIRFNLMVNDNDGDGRDASIGIVPNAGHFMDMSLAPVVRFGKQ